jgi:hypothetical protein
LHGIRHKLAHHGDGDKHSEECHAGTHLSRSAKFVGSILNDQIVLRGTVHTTAFSTAVEG